MATDKQIHANQENAKHSTGPSEEGKANSAGNNFKHGLSGSMNFFAFLPDENPADFSCLVQALYNEHAPQTVTEVLLVRRMAEHEWLRGRAGLLQTETIHAQAPDMEKKLNLYIRYGKAQENGFHKALNELTKLRKDKEKSEIGFKSQERKQAAEIRAVEAQTIKKEALAFKKEELNFKKEVHQAKKAPAQAPSAPLAGSQMAA